MRLIVTEKDNSAKKIAQILSGGKAKEDKSYGTPYYTWEDDDGRRRRDRPQGPPDEPRLPGGLLGWRKVEPRELIDAPGQGAGPEERPQGAAQAGQGRRGLVVIATDYDREGELIGLEALEEILDATRRCADEGSHGRGAPGSSAPATPR